MLPPKFDSGLFAGLGVRGSRGAAPARFPALAGRRGGRLSQARHATDYVLMNVCCAGGAADGDTVSRDQLGPVIIAMR
jgi:hypothetical protein